MPNTPDLPSALTKSPSFQIERVRRHTKDEVERTLAAAKTTMREFWILTCVAEKPFSQTQLSSLLAIDASDMVRLIDSLENHGWVTRDRDPKDRRRQIVTPTKKGTKAQADLAIKVGEAEERALDASSQKQLKSLKKLSKAVVQDSE
ncbi:MarR family winged helix-turn-helix transcriptional regulator [Corynebacterium mayonis]|uniref:MarR family winged helix-turn-helix transcriptional regulator n=1 Tax=Corynebacterium mayonis TaxID=3062461 RepID=UPI0031408F70